MFPKARRESFTLVELSIVLLILSILLGTLLTGRRIVDRAKLQRVIFEVDYYKKSLSLFQDTFDVLPGNLDKDTCMKYSEFSSVKSSDDDGIGEFCDSDRATQQKSRMTEGYVSSTVIGTSDKWSIFLETMRQMRTGKIISEVATGIEEAETVASVEATTLDKGPNEIACKDCISFENVKRTQATTSFDNNGAVTLAGIRLNSSKADSYKLNYIRGVADHDGSGKHEMKDTKFANALDGRNVIFFYRNTPAGADDTFGSGALATGILSADMTNKLDTKLDDGRPGSGRLLAFKNGYAKTEGISEDDKKKICYNEPQETVSSAYYLDSVEGEFGCNFVVVVR